MIGLKYITYSDGWYNVTGKQYIETKSKRIDLEPGLYNFNDLNNFFSHESVSLSVNYTNGFVTLEIPPSMEIELSSEMLSLLGFKHGRLTHGRHTGHKMVDIAKSKELRIFLDQINTTTNFLDGEPSALLGIIPVSNLINGCITELSMRIIDQNNTVLGNHDLRIIIEVLIQ